jgi:hypothetical protein
VFLVTDNTVHPPIIQDLNNAGDFDFHQLVFNSDGTRMMQTNSARAYAGDMRLTVALVYLIIRLFIFQNNSLVTITEIIGLQRIHPIILNFILLLMTVATPPALFSMI